MRGETNKLLVAHKCCHWIEKTGGAYWTQIACY
jgi:hypothetical protein